MPYPELRLPSPLVDGNLVTTWCRAACPKHTDRRDVECYDCRQTVISRTVNTWMESQRNTF